MDSKSISGDPENSGDNGTHEAAGISLQSTPGVSRRSVMKAGAAAAWTVPLVQVVAAAPAMAATSGSVAVLSFTAWSGVYTGKQPSETINTSVTLKNSGGTATANLQVTFTFPAPTQSTSWTPSVDQPSGWTVDTMAQARTHVFTAQTQLAPGASVTLSPVFTVKPNNKGNAVTIDVSATATGSQSTATSIAVPKG